MDTFEAGMWLTRRHEAAKGKRQGEVSRGVADAEGEPGDLTGLTGFKRIGQEVADVTERETDRGWGSTWGPIL